MENVFKKAQELLNNNVYWFKIKKGKETLLEVNCYDNVSKGTYTKSFSAEEIGHDKELAIEISNESGEVNEWKIFCEKNPDLFDKFDEFAEHYLDKIYRPDDEEEFCNEYIKPSRTECDVFYKDINVSYISWDTDTDTAQDCGLPNSLVISDDILREDEVVDYLSDAYGFCIVSCAIDIE